MAALATLSGACTTTHVVDRPVGLESLRTVARDGSVPVDILVEPTAVDRNAGTTFEGPETSSSKVRLETIDPEGVTISDRGRPHRISLNDVRGYDVTLRAGGVVEGMGWGLLTGAALGALIGFAQGDDPPCAPTAMWCNLRSTAGDKALLDGLAGTATGVVVGAVVGAIVGHTDHYVF